MLQLISELKKVSSQKKVNIWKRIAYDLEYPTRNRREVNITDISKHTKQNDSIIVPGKVLGTGDLMHKVNVAAWTFSESAQAKIKAAGGSALSIHDVLKSNPEGKKLRIIG